jgi:hypothetical protein
MTRSVFAALLLALGTAAGAAHGVELRPGQPLAVTLPADGFSNAVFIDVPSGAERLTVRLDAANLAQDVDLLLRYDAPFPDASFDGRAPTADWLMEHAHFRSISQRGDESVIITPASKQPLRGGRLYLSLINFSSSAAPATLSASLGASTDYVPFELQFDNTADCDVSGWNDTTPRPSVRGNNGTTLGQLRRNAMQEAARLMAEELRPNAPIRMQLCWSDALNFEATDNGCSGTLAQAGPRFVLIDNPGSGIDAPMLDSRYVVQATTVASHQSGTARCRAAGGDCRTYAADVRATFSTKFDSAANSVCHLDYGFASAGTSGPSFISTAMHEIAHGMGFIGLMALSGDDIGKQPQIFGQRFDDGFGRHAIDIDSNFNVRSLLRIPVEERMAVLTGFSRLRFAGDATRASSRNVYAAFAAPENAARLHSPGTLSAGSTYSHLAVPGHSGNLMTASISSTAPRTLGLGIDMLADVGWSRAPRQPPTHAHAPGQYYDVARNGHGFDLRPIAGFDNLYFVVFYSFDADGRPEYFTSTGPIVDGVFRPAAGATGDSLLRNLYLGPNQTIADPDPSYRGDVRIDFADAARHPVCTDGASGRQLDGVVAIMSWDINGTLRQWCTQPLLPDRSGVKVDFGSTWFQPADGGWGLSLLSFPGAGGDGLALQIYFPDAQGLGRWAVVHAPDFKAGQSYPVRIVNNGFCRTCAGPPQELEMVDIGTLSITLAAPGEGSSTVSFDVTWPGAEGGRFTRSNVAIVPVGTPGYRQ